MQATWRTLDAMQFYADSPGLGHFHATVWSVDNGPVPRPATLDIRRRLELLEGQIDHCGLAPEGHSPSHTASLIYESRVYGYHPRNDHDLNPHLRVVWFPPFSCEGTRSAYGLHLLFQRMSGGEHVKSLLEGVNLAAPPDDLLGKLPQPIRMAG